MNTTQDIVDMLFVNFTDRDYSKDYGMPEWEEKFCIFLMVFSTIYFNVLNFILIRRRKNYIIKHRGIVLTIPPAIVSYFIVINILVRNLL